MKADILLVLEGTYPYVRGGVASWVHQMINAYPEYKFALVFIGSREQDYAKIRYELPKNVVHIEKHFVHSIHEKPKPQAAEGDKGAFEINANFHNMMKEKRGGDIGDMLGMIAPQMFDKLDEKAFLYTKKSFERICESFSKYSTDPSFLDFFWTVRSMHAPLWRLAEAAKNCPEVGVIHTISTGYAGFYAALANKLHGTPVMLTEHGIYTKERKIDLSSATWVKDNRASFQKDPSESGYLKELWMGFFEMMGRFCYESSTHITTLYEANRLRQIEEGAPKERTVVVPNGIDLDRFKPLRALRGDNIPKVVTLIGRVVPIKDIKTFIRAMRGIVDNMPQAQGWIVGPDEEDMAYASECKNLMNSLGLSDKIKFLGFKKIEEILPKTGVLALTSISEAQPLVVLEAYAAGVPAVVTDVGSCRQLIDGFGDEDVSLGSAGSVVRIADADAFAKAVLKLLGDEEAWRLASAAGINRVERFYTDKMMFGSYGKLYENVLGER